MLLLAKKTFSLYLSFALSFTLSIFLLVNPLTLTSALAKAQPATFIGSKQCENCHQSQYSAWQTSHHKHSMQHANEKTVLANFNNVTVKFKQEDYRFYKKDQQFWANIKGPDGQFHDYQIKYTFGYQPLQQYMVEFDDGRIQLIPFAWDSRQVDESTKNKENQKDKGQRWFNLYPNFTQKHQEFYWTNTGQNWNYMCADCHSTNVNKNFNPTTNQYKTTFSEINVGCEACHGAASEHINWSENQNKAKNTGKNINNSSKGFSRDLSKSVKQWVSNFDNKQKAHTTALPKTIKPSQQNLMCAQCHSRHVQISNNDHVESNEFGERYLLNLIDGTHYYADGQVYNENFVYGSFLQSKMQANGVVCSNCHDPHSAKLTLPEPVLCLQCHQADSYATPTHHHHKQDSTGAQCVNCHMPETTYMQIDKRRDHRWHIPNAALSNTLSTPDLCLSCHENKDRQWSQNISKQWFTSPTLSTSKTNAQAFAATFYQADRSATSNNKNVINALSTNLALIAQNTEYAPIIRASTLQRMTTIVNDKNLSAIPSMQSLALPTIIQSLKDKDANVRTGAIRAIKNITPAQRWQLLSPSLKDKVLAVRIEAVQALISLWQSLSPEQQTSFQMTINDYIAVQNFNADRGFAHVNLAEVYWHKGQLTLAENAYKNSMRIDPYFINAYINLAELYHRQNNQDLAINTLQQGIKMIPDNSQLFYSLGLAYIRTKQTNKAISSLKQSTVFDPNNAQYHYVYGLSLEKTLPKQAQKSLRKTYQLSKNPQHLYALCEMQIRHRAFQAKQCIQELSQFVPERVTQALRNKLN